MDIYVGCDINLASLKDLLQDHQVMYVDNYGLYKTYVHEFLLLQLHKNHHLLTDSVRKSPKIMHHIKLCSVQIYALRKSNDHKYTEVY